MSARVYGHRGARGHEPENTLLSMEKALSLGAVGIEFDIRLSKDNEPMVIHDDTLERTANGKGLVSDFTYEQLRALDAGKGEKIPHLNDVFAWADRRCELLIELKVDAVEVTEAIIRQWIGKGWDYAQIWVLAFDHRLLAKMHGINPRVQTCANMESIPIRLAAAGSDAHAHAVGPYMGTIDKALIDDARARGMKVFSWTVNEPRDIARIKALGIDGIISDYPDRL